MRWPARVTASQAHLRGTQWRAKGNGDRAKRPPAERRKGNRTGSAGFALCQGANGAGCGALNIDKGEIGSFDMTPIDSVILVGF
ncbi:hypothetical protein [Streptomyces sp. x-80]|uniref:hypothetical protein n=1 Tax=Streptomyces sp. x-80 TaxID=2789282 RepID=UPI003980601E